uniref:Uncharacterized protein n=1 Tax=Anopheles atroparvus TaxID=41427 RepID=A0A182IKR7_ANOAO
MPKNRTGSFADIGVRQQKDIPNGGGGRERGGGCLDTGPENASGALRLLPCATSARFIVLHLEEFGIETGGMGKREHQDESAVKCDMTSRADPCESNGPGCCVSGFGHDSLLVVIVVVVAMFNVTTRKRPEATDAPVPVRVQERAILYFLLLSTKRKEKKENPVPPGKVHGRSETSFGLEPGKTDRAKAGGGAGGGKGHRVQPGSRHWFGLHWADGFDGPPEPSKFETSSGVKASFGSSLPELAAAGCCCRFGLWRALDHFFDLPLFLLTFDDDGVVEEEEELGEVDDSETSGMGGRCEALPTSLQLFNELGKCSDRLQCGPVSVLSSQVRIERIEPDDPSQQLSGGGRLLSGTVQLHQLEVGSREQGLELDASFQHPDGVARSVRFPASSGEDGRV